MESCFAFLTEKRIKRLVVICLEKYHGMTPTEIDNSDVRYRAGISLKVTIPTNHHDNLYVM